MKATGLRTHNHYVPEVYLKAWADTAGTVDCYSLLVAHDQVPVWQRRPVAAVGYRNHLYTRVIAGVEADDIERWLEREFETPAAEALHAARAGRRITREQRRRLVRFLAAQDARTPARLAEAMQRWPTQLPPLISDSMRRGVNQLERGRKSGDVPIAMAVPAADRVPLRLSVLPNDEPGTAMLKGEVVSGRALWHWSLKHVLTNTLNVLHKHYWTIVEAAPGHEWPTSDNPVVKLSYKSPTDYHLRGRWGVKNGNMLLPLSPRYMLFTQIGSPVKLRGRLSADLTRQFQRFIAGMRTEWSLPEHDMIGCRRGVGGTLTARPTWRKRSSGEGSLMRIGGPRPRS